MSIGGIILLVAFLIGIAAIVLWPLLQERGEVTGGGEQREPGALSDIARLQAQHEAILLAVRDLDFDYQTGKLTADDYREQREALMQRGVETLKLIDNYQSTVIEEAVKAERDAPRLRRSAH